jgi:hypothetical protein
MSIFAIPKRSEGTHRREIIQVRKKPSREISRINMNQMKKSIRVFRVDSWPAFFVTKGFPRYARKIKKPGWFARLFQRS